MVANHMSTRILLTGATGFVGRQILSALVTMNVPVTLVVRGELKRVETRPVDRVILTDDAFAQSRSWWVEALQGVDTVIHAAWFAEPGQYLQSPINLDCLKGTITLAQACADARVRRFVGTGTCFEYDTDAGYLSVDTPLRPATPYAAAKAATYLALNQSLPIAGVEFVWCRLFYLYGEGEDPRRLVPYIHQRLQQGKFADLTDGLQVRDYMDVRDAAASIVATACGNCTGPVNVCSGNGITIRELAVRIADTYGRADLLRFGARSSNIHDPQTVVGILHQTSFEG
jgi:dTDP-6-deoxy-L-talose 4-dehydrogenase (NAD+)